MVTCDLQTIPSLLDALLGSGQHHAGVVLVAGKRLHPSNVGALLRSILRLVEESGEESWEDRMQYLKP